MVMAEFVYGIVWLLFAGGIADLCDEFIGNLVERKDCTFIYVASIYAHK